MEPFKLTILDTVTGVSVEVESHFDARWWAQGNGSCDCNRALEFDRATDFKYDVGDELEAIYGDGHCFGEKRFLITAPAVFPLGEGEAFPYTLAEMNTEYPKELVKQFIKQ